MHWKQFLRWLSKGRQDLGPGRTTQRRQEPHPYDDADWYEVRIGTDALRHIIAIPGTAADRRAFEAETLWYIYQERYWTARLDDPMPGIARRMVWSRQVAWLGNN